MLCEFNRHSTYYCQGSGKVYFDEPDMILGTAVGTRYISGNLH